MPTASKKWWKCDNYVMKKIGELVNKYESLLTKTKKLYYTNISFSTNGFYGLRRLINRKE